MKNRFKYFCVDCGWKGMFFMAEFARRCRPRCGGCGSTFLEPYTKEAGNRIAIHDGELQLSRDAMRDKQGFRKESTK